MVVSDGQVTISLGLQAQKKDCLWHTFLKAIGAVANSPMFAVVPAKLIGETVEAVTSMTDKIEESESLQPILQGNKMDCVISGNATPIAPYVLRQGYWLVANYAEIAPFVHLLTGTIKKILGKGSCSILGRVNIMSSTTTTVTNPLMSPMPY